MINFFFKKVKGGKVFFIYILVYVMVQVFKMVFVMNNVYVEIDGKLYFIENYQINFGMVIDVVVLDGLCKLVVFVIKGVEQMDFFDFW